MRHLTLTRPLVFVDLETTGVNPMVDRIVELSMIKVWPGGLRETLTLKLNPETPIPPESTRFHGITDTDVLGASTFAEAAPEILRFVADADLAGFNVQRFDLPLLRRELARAGLALDLSGRAVVDAQVIYHRNVPRDLAAAYRLYCGRDLVGAHHAHADTEACVEVLDAQLAAHPDLPRTPQGLYDLFNPCDPSAIDPEGRLVWRDDEAVMAFGPDDVRGRPLRDVAQRDRGFLEWMLQKDFHPDLKAIIQNALEGRFPTVPRS